VPNTLEEKPPITEEMLRDPGPQRIEPLAKAVPGRPCCAIPGHNRSSRWPKPQRGGLLLLRRYLCAGTAVLRVSSRGRISCAGTTKVTKANAQDRARPTDAAASRFKAEAARRDSDG
jgi:hypothetical protein